MSLYDFSLVQRIGKPVYRFLRSQGSDELVVQLLVRQITDDVLLRYVQSGLRQDALDSLDFDVLVCSTRDQLGQLGDGFREQVMEALNRQFLDSGFVAGAVLLRSALGQAELFRGLGGFESAGDQVTQFLFSFGHYLP